jgi:hypothetical protein
MTPTKPIILSKDELRAALNGTLTEVRRKVKNARGEFWDHAGYIPVVIGGAIDHWTWGKNGNMVREGAPRPKAPYPAGTRLWVKETHAVCCLRTDPSDEKYSATVNYLSTDDMIRWDRVRSGEYHIAYAADKGEALTGPWKSSAQMPVWASRLWLTVTAVRLDNDSGAWWWVYGVNVERKDAR